MPSEEKDAPGETESANPYAPSEAALDPDQLSESEGSTMRIGPSPPPSEPSTRRWLRNLPTAFVRLFGVVGIAWVVQAVGVVVAAGIVVVGASLLFPPGASESLLVLLTLIPAALAVGGCVGAGWFGPFRSARVALLRGPGEPSTIGEVLRLGLQRFVPLAIVTAGALVAFGALNACTGLAVQAGSSSVSSFRPAVGIVTVVVVFAVWFGFALLAMPVFYVTAATDGSVSEALNRGLEAVRERFGYLLRGFGILVVLAVGMWLALSFLLDVFVGRIAIYPGAWTVAAMLGFWIGLVAVGLVGVTTLFATIEETAGPFSAGDPNSD